jgi:N-acetylmuramic acid 6-phosphate etherase
MKNQDKLPITEERNEKSMNLHEMSPLEIATLMNAEEENVKKAVQVALPVIAQAAAEIATTFNQGGRLFYFGAGTSGRLGVLDASECPPTFGADPEMVQGIIAGGDRALRFSQEGAEDDPEAGAWEVVNRNIDGRDFVVGLAASGKTPYVQGALKKARCLGAKTALITCNSQAPLLSLADYKIVVEVGPEILTGSSRLKAGTAQKQVLNMLSTIAFVLSGKVYSNLMIDVKPTNAKLLDRAVRIIMAATGSSHQEAKEALKTHNNQVRASIEWLTSNKKG